MASCGKAERCYRKQMRRHSDIQANKWKYIIIRGKDVYTDMQADGKTGRRTNSGTHWDRQTHRHTERQADKGRHIRTKIQKLRNESFVQ